MRMPRDDRWYELGASLKHSHAIGIKRPVRTLALKVPATGVEVGRMKSLCAPTIKDRLPFVEELVIREWLKRHCRNRHHTPSLTFGPAIQVDLQHYEQATSWKNIRNQRRNDVRGV